MPRAPQKINSYVFIDFENGGLDKKDKMHSQKYAITEVAALAIDGTNLDEIVKYDDLILPYDESLIYGEEAAKITGITKEMCEKKGVPLKEVVNNLCIVFTEANLFNSRTAKPVLIAHNWAFDRGLLQDIFRRCNVDLSIYVDGDKDAYGNFIPEGIDTVLWAKSIDAPVTENTTKFRLGPCCERAGVDYADGHKALQDILSLADLFRYYVTRLRSGSSDVKITEGKAQINHRHNFQW